jgi:predicted TIM-barrel fold metal-dependent hydrolase
MIVDFHAHYPREEGFAERLVELLPEAGIDCICLCSAGEAFGHAPNDVVLEAAKKYPERIIAFALIELGKDSPSCVDEYLARGFGGFKVTNPLSSYDNPDYFPIYERIERSGLPLLAHTGILMRIAPEPVRMVNSRWMRPICLDAVVRYFPGMNVVGAHMGAPWHEEAAMMARMHPNYYVDLTGAWWGGWRANKSPEFFQHHFFWEGAWDKVVFGTDILALKELIPSKEFHDQMLSSLKLPEDTMRNIYGGTAARLLGLPDNKANESKE